MSSPNRAKINAAKESGLLDRLPGKHEDCEVAGMPCAESRFPNFGDVAHYTEFNKSDDAGWSWGSYKTPEATIEALDKGQCSSIARTAFDKARESLNPLVERLSKSGKSAKRRRVIGEDGDEVDLDRFAQNDPICWARAVRGRKARVIRLGVNIGLSCGNEEKDFAGLLGTVGAVADLLQNVGLGVEVVGMAVVTGEDSFTRQDGKEPKWMITHGLVKAADEPLDVQRLLTLAAPGVLRGCVFGLWYAKWKGRNGLGCCMAPPPAIKEYLKLDYMIEHSWADGNLESRFDGLLETNKQQSTVTRPRRLLDASEERAHQKDTCVCDRCLASTCHWCGKSADGRNVQQVMACSAHRGYTTLGEGYLDDRGKQREEDQRLRFHTIYTD